jgi:hypothetical protein
MHALHELLLKKNARRIDADVSRAFYYAEDRSTDAFILHIDRKINKPVRFAAVKKLNRTLEAFDDATYQLSTKAKLCAGMVHRDATGLVFEIAVKKGLGHTQLARSLKRFKKLIGRATVSRGGEVVEDAALLDAAAYLERLPEQLAAWQAAQSDSDRASGDPEALPALLALEDEAVERCLRTIAKYLEAAAEAGESDATAEGRAVSGATVGEWLDRLERSEARIDGLLGTDEDEEAALVQAMREELREANLTDALHGSRHQIQAGVSNYLLQQQQMFRRSDTQVDGLLSPEELSFTDRDGRPVPIDTRFLEQTGLSAAFCFVGGQL